MINKDELKQLINAIEYLVDQETPILDEDYDFDYESYCGYCGDAGKSFKKIKHKDDCIINLVKKIKKELEGK